MGLNLGNYLVTISWKVHKAIYTRMIFKTLLKKERNGNNPHLKTLVWE